MLYVRQLTQLDTMPSSDRQEIRDIVERWQRSELDALAVLRWAETRWTSYEQPEYPTCDPRSIAIEVLAQLDMLNHQWITPDDAPAILRFLDTAPGSEVQGWQQWSMYWDSIDFDQRRRSLVGVPPYTAA